MTVFFYKIFGKPKNQIVWSWSVRISTFSNNLYSNINHAHNA